MTCSNEKQEESKGQSRGGKWCHQHKVTGIEANGVHVLLTDTGLTPSLCALVTGLFSHQRLGPYSLALLRALPKCHRTSQAPPTGLCDTHQPRSPPGLLLAVA